MKFTNTGLDKIIDDVVFQLSKFDDSNLNTFENELFDLAFLKRSDKNQFYILGGGYSTSDKTNSILEFIRKKEKKIGEYKKNTNLKQCLFLVTNDLYESSSCSISDINLLKKENYVFEKIVLYNETTTQYNIIK